MIKKYFISIFLSLFGLTLISCNAQTGTVMKPKEFSEKCYTEKTILLDVRTPQEYANGHLKGAILIDYLEPNFSEEVAKLDKSNTVYVYCRSGGRSGEAQEIMLKQGFKSVINLDGGIDSWKQEGLPVEK